MIENFIEQSQISKIHVIEIIVAITVPSQPLV